MEQRWKLVLGAVLAALALLGLFANVLRDPEPEPMSSTANDIGLP